MSTKQFTSGKGCNNRKLSDEDRAEIARLYTTPLADGTWMGASTIARMYEVRHPTIYRILALQGVEIRGASEAHRGKACKPITRVPKTPAPFCKCGCGDKTEWNQRKDRWNRYVKGHYTQRGKQGPTYIDGRSHLPYTADWRYISQAVRERDGFQCQNCGADSGKLDVHHRDGNKTNNEDSNLVTLCPTCHGYAHRDMRRGVVAECQS